MNESDDTFGTEGGGEGQGGGGSPPPEGPASEPLELPESDLSGEQRDENETDAKTVPLRELMRMRQRAQEAEAQVASMTERVEDLERVLVEARASVDAIERRQQIDLALLEADAIDLESARLLTELALSQADERDVASVVTELRERKPFLFRTRSARTGSAMGASARQAAGSLADAAKDAARSGDRRALLRYLQIRRGS